jgi:hypothetical protein
MLTMNPPHFRPIVPLPPTPNLALYSWPTVFWRTNSKRRPTFKHLATRVTNARSRCEPCSGHTIWRDPCSDGDAGLAWDWIEVATGVVAMVDPMSVTTNMQLVNVNGDVLAASEAALHFNQFVRRLPWQDEVCRLLRTQ